MGRESTHAASPRTVPRVSSAEETPTRLLRIIARMNVGGPARRVSLLSRELSPRRYETVLVTGAPGSGGIESSEVDTLPLGLLTRIPDPGPAIRPFADIRSLVALRVETLAGDPLARRAAGEAARAHVSARFSAERLVKDIDALYQELLVTRGSRNRTRSHWVRWTAAGNHR